MYATMKRGADTEAMNLNVYVEGIFVSACVTKTLAVFISANVTHHDSSDQN